MKTGSLIRAFVLLAALAIVAAVIFAAGSLNAAKSAGQRQNFFEQFFVAGGPVVWFVLFPMSLITVYLVVEHALTISRKNLLGGGSPRGDQFEQSLADRRDMAGVALREAFDKSGGDWFRARSIVQESLQEQAGRLLRKIEWLNLIGGVSPMVGLFGTVFGMIKLFNAIVAAGGQPQPAQLADGIGIALVTTFWGLFIAIPALAMHGIFRNRIEVFTSEAVTETEAMMPLLHEALRQKPSAPRRAEQVRFTNVPVVPLEGKKRHAQQRSAKK